MRKLDLILENIRDEYMINLLEEGTSSELEALKTKKFLNENLNRIRKMLVEEGALEGVKQHLGDNWGKYLAGAGALGAGAAGMTDTGQEVLGNLGGTAVDAYHQVPAIAAGEGLGAAAGHVGANIGNDIQPAVEQLSGAGGDAYNALDQKLGGVLPGGVPTPQAVEAASQEAFDAPDTNASGPNMSPEELAKSNFFNRRIG